MQLFLYPGRLVYFGPGVDTSSHAHHAFQVTMRIAGDVAFDFGDGFRAAPLTLIAPDRPHAQRASDASIASVYVDPESREGRALAHVVNVPMVTAPDGEDPWVWSSRVLEALTTQAPNARDVDARMLSLVTYLRDNLTECEHSVDALAKRVALSPGRLTHLFSEEIGIPLRPYILWLRLQRAGEALANGRNVTEAAHAAGFADAAHLSRTFRRMFGIPPSVIAAALQVDRLLVGG